MNAADAYMNPSDEGNDNEDDVDEEDAEGDATITGMFMHCLFVCFTYCHFPFCHRKLKAIVVMRMKTCCQYTPSKHLLAP
jgi:hypothetical protein